MNIIFVYDFSFINGGAARIAISEALALSKMGHNVTFFSGVGPADVRLQESGVNVICLDQDELKNHLDTLQNKIAGAIQGIWNKKALKEFKITLSQHNPSDTIVYFHGWSLALSLSLLSETAIQKFHIAIMCHDYDLLCPNRTFFNNKKGTPCNYSPMSMKCFCSNCDKRSYIQKVYRFVRQVIVYHYLKGNNISLVYYSKNAEKVFQDYFPYRYRGYFVPILVDLAPFLMIEPHKNNRYLFIGRLSPEKGVEMFCDAVTQSGVEADVIGTGEKIDELRHKYPNINFLGWLTTDEMAIYIRKARCLIVTSLWKETGPLNVLETQLSYKLPCIMPAECGVSDIVKSHHTGFLYEMGDLKSLCRCIELSKVDGEIELMSENCSKIEYEKYTEERHCIELDKILCDIINIRRRHNINATRAHIDKHSEGGG